MTARKRPSSQSAPPAGRPLRYYEFKVPDWGDAHDQIIDEAAAKHLGMSVLIDRSQGPVEVLCSEPPEPFDLTQPFLVRRWHLFAALLMQPKLCGYWKEWLAMAEWVSHQRALPLGIEFQVIDRGVFELRSATLDQFAAASVS